MAAITLLSTLGGYVCMDSRLNEMVIVRKADGTLKAGHLADISADTAAGIDPNADLDELGGIVLPRYDTDVDTAITSTYLIDIVIPQGGHIYNIKIKNPAGTIYAGEPLIPIASTAGALDKVGDIESEHIARLLDDVITGTTFATVIWGV